MLESSFMVDIFDDRSAEMMLLIPMGVSVLKRLLCNANPTLLEHDMEWLIPISSVFINDVERVPT